MDVDGRRTNARRTAQSATTRTWTVTFRPGRSGAVTVYANSVDSTTNAARQTENMTVRDQRATITSATAEWTVSSAHGDARIRVNTNQFVERVWVRLPNGNEFVVPRTNTGTGNRTWELVIAGSDFPMQVRASETAGTWDVDSETTIQRSDVINTLGQGQILNATPSIATSQSGQAWFSVRTTADVHEVRIIGTHGTGWSVWRNTVGAVTDWDILVSINPTAPAGTHNFTVQALNTVNTVLDSATVRVTVP
jgi:hypothetical protein